MEKLSFCWKMASKSVDAIIYFCHVIEIPFLFYFRFRRKSPKKPPLLPKSTAKPSHRRLVQTLPHKQPPPPTRRMTRTRKTIRMPKRRRTDVASAARKLAWPVSARRAGSCVPKWWYIISNEIHLLIVGFQCRCGGLYCAVHRYSDKHNCTFDYREHGAQEIRRNNPVVVGEKIQKIWISILCQ